MCLAIFARRATAGRFERLVETTEALKAGGQRNVEKGVARRNEQSLRVGNPVLYYECCHSSAKRLSEEIHGVVRMQVVRFGNPLRSERLVITARDVAGQAIGS